MRTIATPPRTCLALLGVYFAATALAEPQDTTPSAPSGPSQIGASSGAQITARYGGGAKIELKPEEEAALIFVMDIRAKQFACQMAFLKPCSADELIRGVKVRTRTIRLDQDPDQDSNYRYKISPFFESSYTAEAIPSHPGLGGFFLLGETSDTLGDLHYNPNGAATQQHKHVVEVCFLGKAYRQHAMTEKCPSQQAPSPAGGASETQVTARYQDGTDIKLKPEEQVALIFLKDISEMEGGNSGVCQGQLYRLCSLDELIKGVKRKDGRTIGFERNPGQDSNYRYTVTISGNRYHAAAIPRHAGLGGFLFHGWQDYAYGDLHYNPDGEATENDEKVQYDTSGQTFRRR